MVNACQSISTTLLVVLLTTQSPITSAERWSRQLTQAGLVAAPTANDWVPLNQPCPTCVTSDRTQGAKVLNYNNQPNLIAQSTNNLQYNLVPDTSSRFTLSGQGQDNGFGTSYQSVNFHNNNNQQQFQIQHPSSGSSRFSFSSVPVAPRPQQAAAPRPQFVEQSFQKQAPQPLVQQESNYVNYAQPSYQTFPPQTQTFVPQQKQTVQTAQQQVPQQSATGNEEVQLLYVPLDTLYQQQKGFPSYQNERYTALPQPVNAALINDFYSPAVKASPAPSAVTASAYRATTPRQEFFVQQPAVTPAPVAKPKAHQPPLAMFMRIDKATASSGPNDVLTVLRGSSKIDVLDSVGKKSPKVFIGPSALPAPDGYSKYELPYLSTIEPSRLERKTENLPFFVAPLSYKTPPGFSKIPLPEPHVGSVVVNSIADYEKKEKTNNPFSVGPTASYTPQTQPQRQNSYQVPSSTPDRQVISLSTNYAFAGRQPSAAPAFATTPKPRITTYSYDEERPNRGNSNQYSNSFDDSFKSTRPRPTQTQTTTTTARPTSIYTTPSFRPAQHFDVDEFFGGSVKAKKKDEQNKLTSDATDRFNFKPIPDNFYPQQQQQPQPTYTTGRPNKYDVFPTVEETVAPHTARPTAINFDNEYSMKQYFKQQSDFKKFESTPSKSTFDYSPSSTRFPSSTPRAVVPSSTPKAAFYETYSTKAAQPNSGTTPLKTFKFKIVDSVRPNFVDFDDYSKPKVAAPVTQRVVSYQSPSTSRPEYDSFRSTAPSYVHTYNQEEIIKPIYNQNRYQVPVTASTAATTPEPASPNPTLQFNSYEGEHQSTTASRQPSSPRYETTTPSVYHLPSELPAISPSLPGLINSLPDDKWMDNAMPTEPTTTTEKVTRRPINRGRRPVTQRTTTLSAYSETSSRRTVPRGRGTRPTNAPRDPDSPNTRVPVTRTSGRVRYNPTNEERSRFRTRNRTQNIPKHVDDQKATQETQAQNIDYQRDVLKQNYPTFRPDFRPVEATSAPATTTSIPSTLKPEVVASIEEQLNIEKLFDIPNANNEVGGESVSEDPKPTFDRKPFDSDEESKTETVVPVQAALSQTYGPSSTSRSIDFNEANFLGLNEPLKKPKKAQPEEISENYPSFYSAGVEHRNRKLISSRYNSEDVTTTEAVTVKPRRTNLVRRPTRPATTTPSTDAGETVTVRPTRVRTSVSEQSSGPVERKVVRVKTRVRKPITTTESPAPAAEVSPRVNYNFRRRGNYNRAEAAQAQKTEADIAEVETSKSNENKPRFRSRNRFVLDTQESQWSPKLTQNSFQPLDAAESGKSFNDEYSFNGEPDIITAESAAASSQPDSYMVNVSAGLYPTDEEPKKGRSDSVSEASNNQILKIVEKGGRRRGVWRKVRVHPIDSLETAESQHIGSRLINSIAADQSKDYYKNNQDSAAHNKALGYSFDEEEREVITGTPGAIFDEVATNSPIVEATSEITVDEITTVVPEVEKTEELEVVKVATAIPEKEESTTVLPDVTEAPQTGLFAEMKQKLSDLFALDDDEEIEEELVPTTTTTTTETPAVEVVTTQVAVIEEASTGKTEDVEDVPTTTSSTPQFKDPMGSLIFATSTATEISQETEICYRGRCIKTEKTKIKRK